MKKIAVILLWFFIPAISYAAWWNPFSWFEKQQNFSGVKIQNVIATSTPNQPLVKPRNIIPATIPTTKQNITPVDAQVQKTSTFYPVVKVVDGDTISVNINGSVDMLRLIGINTPETVDPRKLVECFGKEASDKAKQLLSGKKIRIEKDISQGERDKYGRLLSYIFLENGFNFNKYMIEEGYAYEYTHNLPYKYQGEFKLAQKQAEIQKKGLWADGACNIQNTTTQDISTTERPQTTANNTILIPASSNYICSYNAYNCPRDFSTHREAQAVYEACGGVNNDIHRLDTDKDGLACESLP